MSKCSQRKFRNLSWGLTALCKLGKKERFHCIGSRRSFLIASVDFWSLSSFFARLTFKRFYYKQRRQWICEGVEENEDIVAFHCHFVVIARIRTNFVITTPSTLLLLIIFRCVHQERISIRSVRPSVRRSVRLSVHYACAKTAFLSCFGPRWDPILKQMIN